MMIRDGVEEAAVRRLAAWVRACRVKLRVLEELRAERPAPCFKKARKGAGGVVVHRKKGTGSAA